MRQDKSKLGDIRIDLFANVVSSASLTRAASSDIGEERDVRGSDKTRDPNDSNGGNSPRSCGEINIEGIVANARFPDIRGHALRSRSRARF